MVVPDKWRGGEWFGLSTSKRTESILKVWNRELLEIFHSPTTTRNAIADKQCRGEGDREDWPNGPSNIKNWFSRSHLVAVFLLLHDYLVRRIAIESPFLLPQWLSLKLMFSSDSDELMINIVLSSGQFQITIWNCTVKSSATSFR